MPVKAESQQPSLHKYYLEIQTHSSIKIQGWQEIGMRIKKIHESCTELIKYENRLYSHLPSPL